MNLSEWRVKNAPVERTLTSGLTVQLRRVTLTTLIAQGDIPQTLDALVKKASTTGFTVSDIQEFLPLIDAVVRACVVSPGLADEPDDEHIALSELSYEDRLDIFTWANSAANALAPFRPQPALDVPARRNGKPVRKTAERVRSR